MKPVQQLMTQLYRLFPWTGAVVGYQLHGQWRHGQVKAVSSRMKEVLVLEYIVERIDTPAMVTVYERTSWFRAGMVTWFPPWTRWRKDGQS